MNRPGASKCLSCLARLASARQAPSIVCAKCRKETKLGADGVCELPTVYDMINSAPTLPPPPKPPASAPPQDTQCATHKRPLELYCSSCDNHKQLQRTNYGTSTSSGACSSHPSLDFSRQWRRAQVFSVRATLLLSYECDRRSHSS